MAISIVSLGIFAVPENQALEKSISLIYENRYQCVNSENSKRVEKFWKLRHFESRNKVDQPKYLIRYSKFGCGKGKLGSLVMAPGRTESSLKYIETAYDFIQKGYSPVYIIDHRGQGFSPRVLENKQKGFVTDFNFYIDDFEDFMNNHVLVDEDVDKKKLFLFSNSMGGAISTLYLERVAEKTPFKGTILYGSMVKINLDGNIPYFEWAARMLTYQTCKGLKGIGKLADLECLEYVKKDWKDYDPKSRVLDVANPNPYNMTHSKARFEFRNYLWDEFLTTNAVSPFHYDWENWNGLPLGGPTTYWMWQGTKANMKMRQINEVKKIHTPYMIVTGTRDVRAVLDAHEAFCKKIDRHAKGCTYVPVEGAFHELLTEKDEYRNYIMELAFKFFR